MPVSLSHHVLQLWKLTLPILHLKPDQLFNNACLWSTGKEKIYYRFPPGLGGKSPDSDAEWRTALYCATACRLKLGDGGRGHVNKALDYETAPSAHAEYLIVDWTARDQ